MDDPKQVRNILVTARDALETCIASDIFEEKHPEPRIGYVWIDLEFHWNYHVRRDGFLLEAELFNMLEDDDLIFEYVDDSGSIDVTWTTIGMYTKVTADPVEVAIKERYYPWHRPIYCDRLVELLRGKHIRFNWVESPTPDGMHIKIVRLNAGERVLKALQSGV